MVRKLRSLLSSGRPNRRRMRRQMVIARQIGRLQIENLEMRILLSADWGDAPTPYPTLAAEGGAQHTTGGTLRLGASVDSEANGIHSANADGDGVDEDGVTFGTIQVGALGATATVTVAGITTTGRLDAWIDFNGDGNWGGAGEQIAAGVAVVNGVNPLLFDVPGSAIDATTFARFRLSTAGSPGVAGVAADGEVEDYAITISPPAAASGDFSSTTSISTAADGPSGVFAADVDGDGDMDVLSASFDDDTIAWYENDGSQNFTAHTISTAADAAYCVFAADIDGDGDLDVLSASGFDDTIAWYENDGSQNFTAHTISAAADRAQSVFAADVDGDGDIDVLSASYNDDTIAWYENDGSQNFTPHTISSTADFPVSVFAADVDGDGDLDVLSASGADDTIAWYQNDGSQNFTAHTISSTAGFAYSVFAADVDGDGDLDVLSASLSGKIAWYENVNANGTLRASLNGADLIVTDIDGTGKNNDLTISVSGANLVITDANEIFDTIPAGGVLSNGNKTLTIPLASFTGTLIVDTALGDDLISVTSSLSSLSAGLTLIEGADDDTYRFDTDFTLGQIDLDESGGGIDTLDFSSTTAVGVNVNLGSAVNQVVHTTNLSLNLNSAKMFENIIGGSGDDVLTGNSLDNTFTGNAGNDTMAGGNGDDTYLFGPASSAEADVVTEGNNRGTDTLSFATLTTGVTLDLTKTVAQAVHTNRTIKLTSGSTLDNIVGGSGDDVLTGNLLDNTFTGNACNDTMAGGSGNDTYIFGPASSAEADVVTEGNNRGTDTLVFASLTTGVTLNLTSTAVQAVHTNRTLKLTSGSTLDNIVGGSGDDDLTGNGLDNVLLGNGGNDTLNGLAGRDMLVGGSGMDLVYGGVGDDILISGTFSYYNESTQTRNQAGIDALMAEWTGLDNYTTRISHLRNGTGLNGANVLDIGNVLDDVAIDTLFGKGDDDWFWLFGSDTAPDQGGAEQTN